MEFKKAFKISFLFGLWLFLIHIIGVWSILDLGFLGIYPRKLEGLIGILTAPFIHGSWEHLYSNTPPLIALFTLLFYFHQKIAIKTILGVWLLTGIFVWIFARPVYHIGISGILYGLVSFVAWNGIFKIHCTLLNHTNLLWGYDSGYFAGTRENILGKPFTRRYLRFNYILFYQK
jgi:membrane associated rhomboid family serine protease